MASVPRPIPQISAWRFVAEIEGVRAAPVDMGEPWDDLECFVVEQRFGFGAVDVEGDDGAPFGCEGSELPLLASGAAAAGGG